MSIIDDVNEESNKKLIFILFLLKKIKIKGYNFFVYSPKDEITTEQIVSLFMPECSSI